MLIPRLLICLLLLPTPLFAANADTKNSSGNLHWSLDRTWQMDFKPLAVVQSLDNKKTFILGDDENVHIFNPQGTLLGSLPVSPDVVDIDIEPRGQLLYLVNNKENSFTALAISFTQDIDTSAAPILGNPDAPVTLVEFSDFECPYCSKVKPDLERLLKANKDTLKVAFKHFPLRIHKQAQPAARATIAAQKQGKFWEMHDALFALKKITPEAIDMAAESIGLDMEQYKRDKDSNSTRQQLARDMYDGQQAEVSGTPALFINGVPVKNRSPQAMQTMIDQALKTSDKK